MALNKLRGACKSEGIKQELIASYLGMTLSNFSKKLRESVPFTRDEMFAIQREFFPDQTLDYLFASDGDVPTGRERLHHYAEAIGDALMLMKDGEEPDPEVDEIVELFHDCADAAPLAGPGAELEGRRHP